MSKNAKRRLKEIQAMDRLAGQLREGIYLGDDFIEAHQLVDTSWLEEEDLQEILGDLYENTVDDLDARVTLEAAARKALAMPRNTLQDLADALAEDVLDPEYPIELVEQELRDAGIDPDQVRMRAERIVKLVQGKIRDEPS